MNEPFPHGTGQQLLDLLVDDELNETERRDVIKRLEEEPDGWRRCALAFLEAQSWRRELGGFAGSAPASPTAAPIAKVRSQRPRLISRLATAAVLLLAFASGMAASDLLRPPGTTVALHQESAPLEAEQQAAEAKGESIKSAAEPSQPLSYIRLRVSGGAGGPNRVVQVPVLEGGEGAEDWLLNRPPPVPIELARALEKLGHRITQHRELIPLELSDGQHAILPVDRVEIHTAARAAYY